MAVKILRDEPITTREALIPFSVAGINILAATAAAYDALTPQALLASLALVLLGIPCSIYFARHAVQRILLNVVTMIPLLILTWLLVRDLPGASINWDAPWESFLGHDVMDNLILLLHMLVIIASGRAFSLVTQRDLVQTPIPSVSIFLLAAVVPPQARDHGLDPVLLASLFVLATSSLYLIGQAHSLLWFTRHVPVRVQRHLVVWVLLTSLIIFPVILALGQSMQSFNLARLAGYYSTRYYHRNPFNRLYRGRLGVGFSNSIDLDGAQGPSGSQVVMQVTVRSNASLLWRSTTYDFYLNGQWTSRYNRHSALWTPISPEAGTTVTIDPSGPQSDPGIVQAIAEGQLNLNPRSEQNSTVDQKVVIKVGSIGTMIPVYGAFQITSFSTDTLQVDPRVHVGHDGGVAVAATAFAERGQAYVVRSIVKPPPTTLRLQRPLSMDDETYEAYLQMPDEIYTPVRKKAEEILQEARLTPNSDPLLVVRAFESYLGTNYLYTLKPERPKHGEDPIVDFLLTQKRGYCNYFSGAMVMLCRAVDIPARFAVGFATGDEVDSGDEEGDTITYVVREKDAHSWVEVFLPRYGWYTSDPTAGSSEATNLWGTTWDAISQAAAAMRARMATVIAAIRQNTQLRAYLRLGLAVLLVVVAGLILWRRERPPRFPERPLSSEEAAETIRQSYRRMHRWLKRWGVMKPGNLTAGEFVGYFSDLDALMGETVSELSLLYTRAQYSPTAPDNDDARRAIALLHQLWNQWRQSRGRFTTPETAE